MRERIVTGLLALLALGAVSIDLGVEEDRLEEAESESTSIPVRRRHRHAGLEPHLGKPLPRRERGRSPGFLPTPEPSQPR